MKRPRHKIKTKNRIINKLKSIIEPILERFMSVLVIAIISWLIGILTNYIQSSGVIKKLEADNKNLEWGVDYYRK